MNIYRLSIFFTPVSFRRTIPLHKQELLFLQYTYCIIGAELFPTDIKLKLSVVPVKESLKTKNVCTLLYVHTNRLSTERGRMVWYEKMGAPCALG
jgi:hypothetical protein